MDLGSFSLSISVKDIIKSVEFYEKIGFEIIDGDHLNPDYPMSEGQSWKIMKSGASIIGLFQGMFDDNIITFHPENVLEVQKEIKKRGVELIAEANESTQNLSVMLKDPDGNMIMLDQY